MTSTTIDFDAIKKNAAGGLGDRRLPAGRQHAADHRRAAGRGGRRAGRPAGARRRLRAGQRGDRGGPPVRRGDRRRLRHQPAGAGPRAGRRPSTCRDLHSRATPSSCRSPTAPFDLTLSTVGVMFAPDHQRAADELVRVTDAGREDRAGQLDPERHGRPAVQDRRRVGAAAGRRATGDAVGHPGAPGRAVRRPGGVGQPHRAGRTCSGTTRRSTSRSGSAQYYGPITRLGRHAVRRGPRPVRRRPRRRARAVQPAPTTARSSRRPSTSKPSASGADNRTVGQAASGQERSAHGDDPAARDRRRSSGTAGRSAPPRGRKAWALLGYLLLAERPPSRRHLAELLFADADDPLGALRWTLAELRRDSRPPGAVQRRPGRPRCSARTSRSTSTCSRRGLPTPARC